MLDKLKEIREDITTECPYLVGDVAHNLDLLGEQAGTGKVYNGKNGKGVCEIDLQALICVMVHIEPKTIIEIGTYTGISTCALAKVFKDLDMDLHITTIEYNKDLYNVAIENAKRLGLDNIEFINGNSDIELPKLYSRNADVIFLDGDPLSLEYNMAINNFDKVVGHDMTHLGTKLVAPRGAFFDQTIRYGINGFKGIILQTGECGIGYIHKDND